MYTYILVLEKEGNLLKDQSTIYYKHLSSSYCIPVCYSPMFTERRLLLNKEIRTVRS